MFPFHRKHGNFQSSSKQFCKYCLVSCVVPSYFLMNSTFNVFILDQRRIVRDHDEHEMTDDEYLKYVQTNDNSRHQSTRSAHDRYTNKILREKEDVLLSGLSSMENVESSSNDFRFGPNNNNIFRCLLNQPNDKYRESISMPSSPIEIKNSLRVENISRRKSDTMAEPNNKMNNLMEDYILTLEIDDLASNRKPLSF